MRRATDLRSKTVEYCKQVYFPARWGKFTATEPLDYERYVLAWKHAQPLERCAQKELDRVKRLLRSADELLKEHPDIQVGGPATVSLRALITSMRELEHYPPEADYKPNLREWFDAESIEDIYVPRDDKDRTVLAVAGGYWRDGITGNHSVAWALRQIEKSVKQQLRENDADVATAKKLMEALEAKRLRGLLNI